ncbi:MAG: zinc-dependent metalloprotease [Chitinophagaceae bacterium]
MQKLVLYFLITIIGLTTFAQRPDSTRRPGGSNGSGPKPYREIITSKALSDPGLFNLHKVDEKYYFEIPDDMFGREILVVNRISKAPAGIRAGGSFFGYSGDQIGSNVIRFDKGPNNKVFLRKVSFAEYAKDSTSPMFVSVSNSNIQEIAASFDVKALGKDSSGAVIDITDFLAGDNDVLFFPSSMKSSLRIGGLQNDKSYINSVKSYPINIEIKAVKTYGRTPAAPGSFGGGTGNLTMELNSSMVVLPKVPMQARYFDPRVGYFAVGYTDFDANPQGVENISMIKRWRLEPKPEDMDKYLRGELVEPQKPIIFYIDPATPKKWVPYLIQGVNDWQTAFEKAGFKNAVYAREAPTWEQDSTWSLEDARNSAIVYKPSDIANASGPSISDPRSGEIMESHVNWYHNIMEILRDWYFIQASPNDPGARKMTFDDELMGQLIRFVSSHEVGHTLGLRHNFGSSSTVPVENLRNKAWVEANGHTPSIMDYARFNYVAQPEDNIGRSGIFPRIGEYDKWAIEWGYRRFPQYGTPDMEKSHLNSWVIGKLKDNRLWFGTESNPDDPRSQYEQVGDDAMKASEYGIRNLKRIVPNLMTWTREPNKGYKGLQQIYGQVTLQFDLYMGHVAKYVGGVMETPKMVEESGPIYEIVSESKQKEAVDFLNKNLFNTPDWLINYDILNRIEVRGNIFSDIRVSNFEYKLKSIGTIQDNILARLLGTRNLGKLLEAEASIGSKAYQVNELLADLKGGIWSEIPARKPIDIHRRNLQKSYVNIIDKILNPPASTNPAAATGSSFTDKSDIKSALRAHLQVLRAEANTGSNAAPDAMSRAHLKDIVTRIDNALNPNK